MSFAVENLQAATNDNVPSFLRSPENGTTSDIGHDTLLEFGLIGKGARIINNDSTNNLDLRLHSNRATIQIIPPNSELVIEEWFSVIICQPDSTTGDFQLTLELANLKDARRK